MSSWLDDNPHAMPGPAGPAVAAGGYGRCEVCDSECDLPLGFEDGDQLMCPRCRKIDRHNPERADLILEVAEQREVIHDLQRRLVAATSPRT